MHLADTKLLFSATDLSAFLACPHLTLLKRRVAHGAPRPPQYDDPRLDVLRERGKQHEADYLHRLAANESLTVGTIPTETPDGRRYDTTAWRWLANETLAAMRFGTDVIAQGALFDGDWFGRPDFLRKVAQPSTLGDYSYEVVDTKLAREAKGGALLQVLLYSDLLTAIQGTAPEYASLALGGPEARDDRFRVAEYSAYFRSVRRRFLEAMSAPEPDPLPAPEPVEHCQICEWFETCDRERRRVDHLSFVAGISRRQRAALATRNFDTLGALATMDLPLDPALDGVNRAALERVHHQARIQHESRTIGKLTLHELLKPVKEGEGLASLPEPSPGDLFFDIEGDRFALNDGLEYLFGFVEPSGEYTGWWALDRAAEKGAFERFVDLVVKRRARWPDMHVYHYAPYEPSALKRLMSRHASREDEVDDFLRGAVFVDLYQAVRQGLRASVESYSIKKMEPFYSFEREVDLRKATHALVAFEVWLELGNIDDETRGWDEIEGYNRDDCVSTLKLREWLEKLRDELAAESGQPVPRRPAPEIPEDSERDERRAELRALYARLMHDVPADAELRTDEQKARWLAAQLLEYHRREKKSMWWEFFRCIGLGLNELVEDRSVLAELEYVGEVGREKRSLVHRYRFPLQDHALRVGKNVVDKETKTSPGTIVEIDPIACTIDLMRGERSAVPHPRALVVKDAVDPGSIRASIARVAAALADRGTEAEASYPAAIDLLMRRPPRLPRAGDGSLMRPHETTLDAAVRLTAQLDRGVLPIQGPPGAGKTFTAARMILRALNGGKRVGITATSHKVIGNLLDAVCTAAREKGTAIAGIQKAKADQRCNSAEVTVTDNNDDVRDALASGSVRLAAGTSWLWSREDMAGSVDILFVDEAGQFNLADALAVAPAAPAMVLVGDPRQLEHPQQGVHPPGAELSALDHLLGDSATVSPDRGLFLSETWRLHPTICDFTSEIFYANRLRPRPGLERQQLHAPGIFSGSGLRYVPVEHAGNQDTSAEEVRAVADMVRQLLESGATWTDEHGVQHELGASDILIVAPYNVHVAAIARQLKKTIANPRVGTVDKFQGQEAPVVIYSLATSSPEEAPRGMDFLYNPSRLNVATSRARCLVVVVASPLLFAPECRTPAQMRLANAFCRFQEMAEGSESRA